MTMTPKTQTAIRLPADLIEQIDRVVRDSRAKYASRSHYVTVALNEKLERDTKPAGKKS